MRQLIVIGARDRAVDIIAAARSAGRIVRGVYDDDGDLWGTKIAEVPVLGPISQALYTRLPAVMALADPYQRREIAVRWHLEWTIVSHPRAVVDRYVAIRPGAVFLEGAVVQPGSTIGAHAVVGVKVTVAHDCVLDDFADLRTRVQLAGTVRVGEGSCLDSGTVVIPNTTVGNWTYVAPASVVIRDLPDFARASGVPARFVTVPPVAIAGTSIECARPQTS